MAKEKLDINVRLNYEVFTNPRFRRENEWMLLYLYFWSGSRLLHTIELWRACLAHAL